MKHCYHPLCSKHFLLLLLLTLITGTVCAQTPTEDFENLTLVDANGNALANSWSFGYGLSNGWKVVGGSILTNAGSTNYGLIISTGKGHNESNGFIESSYGKTNAASVFVPTQLKGTIKFWAKSNLDSRSKSNSSLKIFEATEDGTVTSNVLYEATPTKGSATWVEHSVEGLAGKYIAINLIYTDFDDFYAEGEEGGETPEPVFVEKKALQLLAFDMQNEYELSADENNQFSVSFTVRVRNTSNVKLGVDEVSVSLTNSDGSTVYTTQTATGFDSLAIDGETSITLTATIPAGETEYWAFYARENVTGTFMLNEWGNNKFNNVHVKPYFAKFAIKGPDGYALFADETIAFGYTNKAVSKQIVITNDGTAPLAVSSIALPNGFTASEQEFSVAAGGQKAITLTLTPDEGGYGSKGGEATITHALGTFTFKVSGTTVDPAKFFVGFDDGQMPEAWQAETGWSVSVSGGNYFAQQNSTSGPSSIVTQKLAVKKGEKLSFQAKRAFAYNAAMLVVYYSATGKDDSWQVAQGYEDFTSAFETYTISGLPAGNYYFRFLGQYVAIDNIIGFSEATDQPLLAVMDAEGRSVANKTIADFGKATADSTQTYYVKNVGTGTLTAMLSTAVGTDFTVTPATVELAAGEQLAVSITMQAQPWGEKLDTMLVVSEGLDTFRLVLTGVSRDPDLLFVDFQDQQLPRGWEAGGKWMVSWESFGSENYWAEVVDYTNALSPLTTAKVRVAEGDVLTLDAKAYESYVPQLSVSYSADRNEWTQAVSLTAQLKTDAMTTLQVEGLPAGEWYLRFEGSNVMIDNITGIHQAAAAEHQVVVTGFDVPATCEVNETATITARVKNLWADLETVSAVLMIDGEQQGEAMMKTVARNAEASFAFAYTPRKAADSVKVQVVFSYADCTLQTAERTFEAMPEREDKYAHTLSGIVTDEQQQPLEGVSIRLQSNVGDAQYEGTSDVEGKFSIRVLQGLYAYKLTASKEGYQDTTKVIAFGGEDITDLELVLQKLAEQIDTTQIDTTVIDTTVIDTTVIDTTVIDSTQIDPTLAIKSLYREKIVTCYYDLQGRPVARPQKGSMYIRNGRKYVRKE